MMASDTAPTATDAQYDAAALHEAERHERAASAGSQFPSGTGRVTAIADEADDADDPSAELRGKLVSRLITCSTRSSRG